MATDVVEFIKAWKKRSSLLWQCMNITKDKGYVTLTSGLNVIKLFTIIIYDKLQCLSLESLSSIGQSLQVRPEST
jgi:hypothetical protein